MHKFKKLISRMWGEIVILALVLTISYLNKSESGWLIGWDNLQTELDSPLNIKRSLSAVWQEYQGLGLLGGMGHASDALRSVIVLVISWVFGSGLARYIFHALMLIAGAIGVYRLIMSKFLSGITKRRELLALVGAIFYLLNLGTILYFYMPFEPYSMFFAGLPWEILVFLNFLKKPDRRNLLYLMAVNLLFSGQAYVQTLFLVYAVVLGVFSLSYVSRKRSRASVKRVLVAGLATLAVNAYWILPAGHFVANNFDVHRDSGQVKTVTDKFYLINRGRGSLEDFALLRLFYYDFSDYNLDAEEFQVYAPQWVEHYERTLVLILGSGLFVVALFGLIRDYRYRNELAVMIALSLVAFATDVGAISYVNEVLRENELFDQLFRNAYTKLIVPMALAMSILLPQGIIVLNGWMRRVGRYVPHVVIVAIMYMSMPLWSGNYISEYSRVELPESYLSLFRYFSSQNKSERIALYPAKDMWGWSYNDWGYRGSGFLWYGIEQPILDRAFDVWSYYNEGFYREYSRALYMKDAYTLSRVLDKYDVTYILVDESVIDPGRDISVLMYEEVGGMLMEIGAEEVWSEGFLSVYRVPADYGDSFVDAPKSYYLASGDTKYARLDNIYGEHGEYLESGGAYYPFADLARERVDQVLYLGDLITGLTRVRLSRSVEPIYSSLTLPVQEIGDRLTLPYRMSYEGRELTIEFEPVVTSEYFEYPELPEVRVNAPPGYERILVEIGGSYHLIESGESGRGLADLEVGESIVIDLHDYGSTREIPVGQQFQDNEIAQCWTREGGDPEVSVSRESGTVNIRTKDAAGCLSIRLGEIANGVVDVSLPYRSGDGARPNFCFNKQDTNFQCLHDDVFYSTTTSSEWSEVSRRIDVDNGIYWLDVTGRPSDLPGEEWSIEYGEPVVTHYPRIERYTVGSEFWDKLLAPQTVPFDGREIVINSVPRAIPVDFSLNGRTTVHNCDVLSRGLGGKEYAGGVRYFADERGGACDTLILNDIDQDGEYLMRWVGENVAGRSLKFYLYSPDTKRSEVEYLLPEGEFDHTVSVLSQNRSDSSYTLTAETRSFGEYAENRIESVTMYPLPIDWLSRISVGEGERRENDLNLRDVKKIGTFMYVVDASNIGDGLITLSQGYDKGWIAWVRGAPHELLSHSRVSGWKNGWEVEDQGEIRIVIFFWPQMLQYVGYGILICAFAMLVRKR